eukprot:COSAG02_NODE_2016_length_10101_cov_10.944011_1_plen_48_part_10
MVLLRAGLSQEVVIDRRVQPNARVTVKLDETCNMKFTLRNPEIQRLCP